MINVSILTLANFNLFEIKNIFTLRIGCVCVKFLIVVESLTKSIQYIFL